MALSQRRERRIGRLRSAKTRAREGAVLVEGVRAVSEALGAAVEVDFVVTSPRLRATPAGARLAERLTPLDVVALEDDELDRLSDTNRPQGVLLVCAEPTAGLDRIERGARYLVLDQIQDPGNAGTLVRASVAFGLAAVLCLDGTADPWSAKSVRASAGMTFRIPVVRTTCDDAVACFAAHGVPLLVADPEGEEVAGFGACPSFALVVGNEGAGVRPELRARADRVIAVDMLGPAESLNVAMAGSILLHILTRGSGHA